MWEVRTFEFVIPANSARYIDVLDSIEITSSSKNETTIKFDTYRIVTTGIIVNAGNGDVVFDYTQSADQKFIRKAELSVDTTNTITGTEYSKKDVEIVNASIYSRGLYETKMDQTEQSFNTNISLINNTAETKSITLNYQLYYYISNGNRMPVDANGKRAEEYVHDTTWTHAQAFAENLCYGYSIADTNGRLTSSVVPTVIVAPFSSVKLVDNYKISSQLQSDIATTSGNNTTNYDVWTYLFVEVAKNGNDEMISTVNTPAVANLPIETTINGNTVSLSVKNNTTSTIKNINISSFSIEEMTKVNETDQDAYTALESKPSDWVASFWKYYSREQIGGASTPTDTTDDTYRYTQLTSDPLAESGDNTAFPENTYFVRKQQTYDATILTFTINATLFSKNGDTITNKTTVSLQPGESIEFATATTTETNHVIVKGYASSSSVQQASGVMLINNGTEEAYLINYTENSYYIRFSGAVDSENENFKSGSVTINGNTSNHTYYIGILRPGQIVPVAMTAAGELTSADMVLASDDFNEAYLTSKKWSPAIIELFTKYFALVKTTA